MSAHVEQLAVFLVMSVLVTLFAWIYVRDRQQRVAWWMFAWIAGLIHFAARVLWSYSLLSLDWMVLFKTSLLAIAGLSFHLSGSEVLSSAKKEVPLLLLDFYPDSP